MTAVVSLAFGLEAPAIIDRQVPDLPDVANRFDARLRDRETARIRLHMVTMFLNVWRTHDLPGALARLAPVAPSDPS